MRRIYGIFLALVLILAVMGLPARAQAPVVSKLSPGVQRLAVSLAADARVGVIVRLNDQLNPQQVQAPPGKPGGRARAVIDALQAQAARSQVALLADLGAAQGRGEAGGVTPLWIVNAVRVEAGPALLNALARRADVAQVTLDNDPSDPIVPVDNFRGAAKATGAPEPNLGVVGATQMWAMGFRGQGITVAVLDTGVDATQPDLAQRYRGGANSWYDPYGENATPTDSVAGSSGHGTGVTGIIMGDGSGNGSESRATGVAPAAQWIAAKIFPNAGAGSADLSMVHLAFQWVLDPDGDPDTADAPQIANNSWDFSNPGACNPEFQPDVNALRAAGISVVFAAGNILPTAFPNSSVSPANNLGVISAGSVDNTGTIAGFSALGVNACDTSQIFPSLMAPGVTVETTGLFGAYLAENGTSFSAPHVSGGLALLLSFFPHFSPDQLETALRTGATDLGAPGPDSSYGYGLLNLPASQAALNGQLQHFYMPEVFVPNYPKVYLPVVLN